MISAVLIYLAVRGYSDIRQKDVAASAQVYPNYKINKNLSTLASFSYVFSIHFISILIYLITYFQTQVS